MQMKKNALTRFKELIPPPLHILLRNARHRLRDNARMLIFFVSYKKRKLLSRIYSKCTTKEDYLTFCNKISAYPWQHKEEIFGLLSYAMLYKPKCVIEIGTADCGVTFLLSHVLESASLVIGIDLCVQKGFLLHYFSKPKQTVKFINGPSCHPKTIAKVKNILGDKKVDLLFIDGDHSYDGVKKDFLNYRQFMAEDGLIAFHDILPDYFTLYGVKTKNYAGGVPDFYKLIKGLYPSVEFVKDPNSDGMGIGLIKYSHHIILPYDLKDTARALPEKR